MIENLRARATTLAVALGISCLASATASAGLAFDIFDGGPGDDDGAVGYIEFATGGLITTVGDVVSFQYTTELGTTYTKANIAEIRVLVDNANSRLCWAALNAGTSCEPLFDTFAYQGLGLTADTIVQYGFGTGTPTPNFATAYLVETDGSRPLDRFLDFAPHGVPEPVTVALFGLGLAGIGYQRRKHIKAA